jgi:hypothetical protein
MASQKSTKLENPVKLTAITGKWEKTTDPDYDLSYTYTTAIKDHQMKGAAGTAKTLDVAYQKSQLQQILSLNSNLSSCALSDITVYYRSGDQGTVTFNGTMTGTQKSKYASGSSASYYNYDLKDATAVFSNYGTGYSDQVGSLKFMKAFFGLYNKKYSELTCDDLNALIQFSYAGGMGMGYGNYLGTGFATLGGTVTMAATSDYKTTSTYTSTSTGSSNSGVYTGTSTSTSKSSDLTIDGASVPMDLVYKSDANYTSQQSSNSGCTYSQPTADSKIGGGCYSYTFTGTWTLSLSGTVNGASVSDSVTVTF